MDQTPIYEEVRRTLGLSDRLRARRWSTGDEGEHTRASRPVALRAGGGRHRRGGD